MFSRWHHGHSLATGALLMLAVESYKMWLLLAFVFVLGCAATLLILNARKLIMWVKDTPNPLMAKVETEHERAKEVRARRRLKIEQARELRRERDKRERQAYIRGAADAEGFR